MEAISQTELAERICIVRRFRSLLEMQCKKFKEYLTVLEMQQGFIENDNAEIISAHTELGQRVVQGIGNIQKVLHPLAALYKHSARGTDKTEDARLDAIQADLERLKLRVLMQNEQNRALLRLHLAKVREQLEKLENPYRGRQSAYAASGTAGRLVAVEV